MKTRKFHIFYNLIDFNTPKKTFSLTCIEEDIQSFPPNSANSPLQAPPHQQSHPLKSCDKSDIVVAKKPKIIVSGGIQHKHSIAVYVV